MKDKLILGGVILSLLIHNWLWAYSLVRKDAKYKVLTALTKAFILTKMQRLALESLVVQSIVINLRSPELGSVPRENILAWTIPILVETN